MWSRYFALRYFVETTVGNKVGTVGKEHASLQPGSINLDIIIKATQLLSEINLSMVSKQLDYFRKPTWYNHQNNSITFTSQLKHSIKTTRLLSEANLGITIKTPQLLS